SIRPYQDCCSFMIAEHPATKMSLNLAEEIERNIKDKEELILDAVKNAEVKEYKI
ncbi:tRNA 4-thiouridine(8) synthase ThiI, partial [Candidatus Woesearchaeota archaeon]